MADRLIQIRPYQAADFEQVADLWSRTNREPSPPAMAEDFDHYVQTIIADELSYIHERFVSDRRSGFWVVEMSGTVVGCFGIERHDRARVELRRMYLDSCLRGSGLAAQMLLVAEDVARRLGYTTMILSTAEIQKSALRFYEKQGYRNVRTEIADTLSVRTVGGGLRRFHFEKRM